jgi:hypothetical protein
MTEQQYRTLEIITGKIRGNMITYALPDPETPEMEEFNQLCAEFETEYEQRQKRRLLTVMARRGRRLELTPLKEV